MPRPLDDAPAPARPARLHGLHRGADVSGDVDVRVAEGGVVLRFATGSALSVAWDALDGVQHAPGTVTLFLAGDDVLELEAVDDAAALATIVAASACRLGELTLALRGLGSVRANPGSDHERFFDPLLATRRALAAARTPEAQWAAVDAVGLREEARATLAAFAAERFPEDPADCRALEAELLDHASDLIVALERLDAARAAALAAPADARFAHWREWADALRGAVAAYDRAWIAALPALCDSRGRRGRFWRRLLGWRRGA